MQSFTEIQIKREKIQLVSSWNVWSILQASINRQSALDAWMKTTGLLEQLTNPHVGWNRD